MFPRPLLLVCLVAAAAAAADNTVTVPKDLMRFILGCQRVNPTLDAAVPVYSVDIDEKSGTTSQKFGMLNMDDLSHALRQTVGSEVVLGQIMEQVEEAVAASSRGRGKCNVENKINIEIPPQQVNDFNDKMQQVAQQNNFLLLEQINNLFTYKLRQQSDALEKIMRRKVKQLNDRLNLVLQVLGKEVAPDDNDDVDDDLMGNSTEAPTLRDSGESLEDDQSDEAQLEPEPEFDPEPEPESDPEPEPESDPEPDPHSEPEPEPESDPEPEPEPEPDCNCKIKIQTQGDSSAEAQTQGDSSTEAQTEPAPVSLPETTTLAAKDSQESSQETTSGEAAQAEPEPTTTTVAAPAAETGSQEQTKPSQPGSQEQTEPSQPGSQEQTEAPHPGSQEQTEAPHPGSQEQAEAQPEPTTTIAPPPPQTEPTYRPLPIVITTLKTPADDSRSDEDSKEDDNTSINDDDDDDDDDVSTSSEPSIPGFVRVAQNPPEIYNVGLVRPLVRPLRRHSQQHPIYNRERIKLPLFPV